MGTSASAAKMMVSREVAMGAIKDIAPGTPNVNWETYNFPPLLNLFHLTYGELDVSANAVAQKIIASWGVLVLALVLNFVDTCVLVGSDTAPRISIMYSIFNLFIGMVVGTYMLFVGYYGIGKPDTFSLLKFKVLVIVICLTSL